MLENESAREQRKGRAFDSFRIDRHDRHPKKISDRFEETLLAPLPRIEHLRRPGTAVEVRGKLRRFLARRHTAGEQKIDERITDRRIHALILLEPWQIVIRRALQSLGSARACACWRSRARSYLVDNRYPI